MDKIIAALTTLLEQWIDRVGGAATEHTLAGPISVGDLWIVALYLGFALLLNAAVALILRRRRKAAVALAKPNWHRRAYLALGKPLYVLLWAYGVYLAATPILLELILGPSLRDSREICRLHTEDAARQTA
jgi:hypothetical protein